MTSDILGRIDADYVDIGRGVVIEADVVITGKHGRAEKVILGDYCYIGRGARIMAPEFRLGHYSKLHAGTFGHGEKALQIGRNCWIGGDCVLDSMGGLDIDDNVGIGAHSQLWTHIQFGDIVEGCRFYGQTYMHVQKDAWFVGHCIVSPVQVGARSMALAGSVVTKDMQPNHVYAGVPAKDVTNKLGPQFEERNVGKKALALLDLIDAFEREHPEYNGQLLVAGTRELYDYSVSGTPHVTIFDVSRRVYHRTYSPAEVAFLKRYTPLVKFTAAGEPSFIQLQSSLQVEAVV